MSENRTASHTVHTNSFVLTTLCSGLTSSTYTATVVLEDDADHPTEMIFQLISSLFQVFDQNQHAGGHE